MEKSRVNLSGQHVLVTGGTGFLGSHIVTALLEQHPDVKLSVLDITKPTDWKPPRRAVEFYQADITRPDEVQTAISDANPTILIHSAGIVPAGSDRYSNRLREPVYSVNVEGTKNVLSAAKAAKVKAFIYTGSITIITDDNANDYRNFDESTPIGNAFLIYGASKALAEPLILAENSEDFRTCALRPSVICGPGDTQLVPTIHACIAKGETPFIIGEATNLYDFTYVTNVADAHVLAVENLLTTATAAGEAFLITNGEPMPFRDFCLAVWANFGHVPKFQVTIPVSVASVVGFIAERATWLLGTQATLSRGSVRDYTQTAYANISKARRVLGYEPRVGLDEGLKIACEVRTISVG
jgi:sterol-4alpha-carboxylate 3-dehydrogenase (decarboxylating)